MKRLSNKEWIVTGLFLALKLLSHILTYNAYEPHRDEFLYMAMKDHLDWGYLSVPPFVGFMAKLASLIFGNTLLGYKLFPAMAGLLTLFLVILTVKEMGGKLWALVIAGSSFLLSPAFLHINALLQPVCFDILFWTLLLYLSLLLVTRKDPVYLIWIGIFSGLAMLNKYSTGLLLFAVLTSLLLSRQRKILFHRNFLIALFTGLAIIAPNLLWQYNHGFPVMHHLGELYETQLVNVTWLNFSIDQLVMNHHAIFIWIPGLLMLLFAAPCRTSRWIGLAYILLYLLLILTHGKGYYMAGIYPVLIAAGGVFVERYLTERLTMIKYALVIMLITTGIISLPLGLPFLEHEKMERYGQKIGPWINYAPFRWEDGRIHPLPQDWADMTGWKELSDIVIHTYQDLAPQDRDSCYIYAENYGHAGAIKYYGQKLGLPEPISFSDNFLLWSPDSIQKLKYLIYVNDETVEIRTFFKQAEETGKITNTYARESGLGVYLCTNPSPVFKVFYSRKVSELSRQFLPLHMKLTENK